MGSGSNRRELFNLAARHQPVAAQSGRQPRQRVVGDADQGVYSWRGATIQNLLDFERDYPDATVFLMEQNYRSTQTILGIANALIANNRQRKPKTLWTEAGDGELAIRYRAEDEHEEARFVAEEVARLREEEGFKASDIAVFYRTNAQSRVLEDIFQDREIGFRLVGGVRFYERREVKDLLAYLRLLVNPQDLISAQRVINMPKRGIGDATVAAIEDHARTEDIPFLEACRRVDEIGILAARAKGAVAGFVRIMDRLQAALDSGAGVARMVAAATTESGYLLELQEERTIEAEGRIENLRELEGSAAEFAAREPDGTLADFLESVALSSDQDDLDDEGGDVTFMTLHIAKGLEFPVVFMVGMEDNVFPHFRSLGNPEQLEEERRHSLHITEPLDFSSLGGLTPPAAITASLPANVKLHMFKRPNAPTTRKARYIDKSYLRKLFEENRWTDFMPIVLPTEERVAAMLKGTSQKPDKVVGRMRAEGGVLRVTPSERRIAQEILIAPGSAAGSSSAPPGRARTGRGGAGVSRGGTAPRSRPCPCGRAGGP